MERLRLEAPWLNDAVLRRVFAALGAPAINVRAVGGCVRDAILGRPVTDVDVATPDVPDVVIAKLETAGLKAVPTGIDHGTVTAVADGRGFEITTLRKDTACDGRYAAVEFTLDWQEDAARRDFTFNAMSVTPAGDLSDYFGGQADAEGGVVRFVGAPADRIREDYLRILRFFRFLAHYGKTGPDAGTLAACRDHRAGLQTLSADRVRSELIKLLMAPDPREAVGYMNAAGVLSEVLPEAGDVARLNGLIDAERTLGAVSDTAAWYRRWIALVPSHDAAVAKRLRMSNKDAATLAALQEATQAVPPGTDPSGVNPFLYRHHASACDAILVASAQNSDAESAARRELLALARSWQQPVFPLTGADAKAAGVPEGPEIGAVLSRLENRWIESGFTLSREELVAAVKAAAGA